MRTVGVLVLVGVMAGGCGGADKPRTRAIPEAPAKPDAPLVPVEPAPPLPKVIDQGMFVLELDGAPLGHEKFTIRALVEQNGFEIETESHATFTGQPEIAIKSVITTDGSWRATKAQLTMQQGARQKLVDARTGVDGLLETTITQDGQTKTTKVSVPVDLIVTGNTVAQFAALCALPAEATGKKVLWPDQTLKYEAAKTLVGAEVAQRRVLVRSFKLGSSKSQLACEDGKPAGIYQRATKLVAVREGDAALAAALKRAKGK
jgi:hypothetical protein